MNLKNYIRSVKDFPKTGIDFKDITPLLASPQAFSYCIDELARLVSDQEFNKIGAFDARGFWFAPALADRLKIGWFPLRKKGKLPFETISQSYGLEYRTDTLAIHTDAVEKGDKILLIDDLLATGGTLKAGAELVKRLGGEVTAIAVLIELLELRGKEIISPIPVLSLLTY